MNRTIKSLNKQLATLVTKQAKPREKLEEALQAAWNRVFKRDKALQAALKALESSNEYGSDEAGIYRWTRYTFEDEHKAHSSFLESYLQDACVHADMANDSLVAYEGSSLIINEDGDVYDEDSSKHVIEKSEYTVDGDANEGVRNILIESHMENTGHFPGVFRTDRNGNVFSVSTLENTVTVATENQQPLQRHLAEYGIKSCIRNSNSGELIVSESDCTRARELIKEWNKS